MNGKRQQKRDVDQNDPVWDVHPDGWCPGLQPDPSGWTGKPITTVSFIIRPDGRIQSDLRVYRIHQRLGDQASETRFFSCEVLLHIRKVYASARQSVPGYSLTYCRCPFCDSRWNSDHGRRFSISHSESIFCDTGEYGRPIPGREKHSPELMEWGSDPWMVRGISDILRYPVKRVSGLMDAVAIAGQTGRDREASLRLLVRGPSCDRSMVCDLQPGTRQIWGEHGSLRLRLHLRIRGATDQPGHRIIRVLDPTYGSQFNGNPEQILFIRDFRCDPYHSDGTGDWSERSDQGVAVNG